MAESEELDALGTARRAQVVAAKLTQLQQQRLDLEVTQLANSAKDSDPAPGVAPGDDGEPVTYKEQDAKLLEAEKKITSKYKSLMPMVTTYLEAQNQQTP